MPTYNLLCQSCSNIFEKELKFAEYDEVNLGNGKLWVDCPYCPSNECYITYDEPPHSHIVNNNNVGIFAEKNAKKIGKIKIEEEHEKRQEILSPKTKPNWYGRLSKDKQKAILNPRKSKEERQRAAQKYILTGE